MSKLFCDELILSDHFLSYDHEDSDSWISRCNEQWNLFTYLYSVNQFELAFQFGSNAQIGEFDQKYYLSEWEVWHCEF